MLEFLIINVGRCRKFLNDHLNLLEREFNQPHPFELVLGLCFCESMFRAEFGPFSDLKSLHATWFEYFKCIFKSVFKIPLLQASRGSLQTFT